MNNMYPGYSGSHGPMSASVSTHGAFFRYMSSRDMRAGGVKQEVTCLWVEPDQARIDTLSNLSLFGSDRSSRNANVRLFDESLSRAHVLALDIS